MKYMQHNTKLKGPGYIFLLALMTLFASGAFAVGPVDVGSVPGGATVTDSDGGSGEQWGRAGGRSILYEDFDIGNFTLLNWQALAVGMAFDGEITGATAEEMSGPVNIFPDTLEWTGETTITDASNGNAIVPVYTRFTVVASENFTGIPDRINIISAGGDFLITVLFEASLNPGGPWQPALDFFDNFDTPAAHDGFAHTSFESGFFFEVLEGMTIEEHDSNMQGRFDHVDGVLQFLKLEFEGWIPGINATAQANNDLLQWVKMDLEELLDADPNNGATIQEIGELINNLMNYIGGEMSGLRDRFSETDGLIICLWVGDIAGTCPDVPFELPNLLGLVTGQTALMDKLLWVKTDLVSLLNQVGAVQTSIDGLRGDVNTIQSSIDTLTEKVDWVKMDLAALAADIASSQSIDVTAVKSNPASGSDDTIMVLTSLNGLPTDAEITSVTAVTESKKSGLVAEALVFSTSPVTSGLQGLVAELPGNLGSIKSLMITVEYSSGGGNTLHGSVLISDWN